MSRRRNQGYRLVIEFKLPNPAAYPTIRDDIRSMAQAWERGDRLASVGKVKIEFIAIEAVEEPNAKPRAPKTRPPHQAPSQIDD